MAQYKGWLLWPNAKSLAGTVNGAKLALLLLQSKVNAVVATITLCLPCRSYSIIPSSNHCIGYDNYGEEDLQFFGYTVLAKIALSYILVLHAGM
jgi:hypothetical protein